MTTCKHCDNEFEGRSCPLCGWRERPVVERGTPEATRRHWERVYGVPVRRKEA